VLPQTDQATFACFASLREKFSWLCRTVRVAGRALLIGSIIALTLITLEEFSQRLIPYRTFDLVDLIADYSGVFVFSGLAIYFNKMRRWAGSSAG